MKNERIHIQHPALGCMMGRAYQKMLSQLAVALKEAGLDITTGEYLLLRAIDSNEGLQQCEIADIVGKDKAAVCRCVAGLEKKGLVATEAVSHKCLRVFLTDKSKAIVPAIIAVAEKRNKALADLTSPEELEVLSRVLEKIINS